MSTRQAKTEQTKSSRSRAVATGNTTRRSNRRAADIKRAEAAGFNARGEQDWVPVHALFSDPRYQRTVDHTRVERMAAEFNPDALGVIYVSDRGNSTFAVMDGFHRVALMRYLQWDDQKMPAFVFTGLTVQEEARIFTMMNKDRRQPQRLQLFTAQVTAGDETATAVNDVLIECDVAAASGPGARNVQAIAQAERIVALGGPDTLRRTLKVLTKAWPHHDDALIGSVLSGVALLIFARPGLDDRSLASRLSEHTPAALMNKAKMRKEVNPEYALVGAIAATVTQMYNTRRRSARLPAFEYTSWPKKDSRTGKMYGHGWSSEQNEP